MYAYPSEPLLQAMRLKHNGNQYILQLEEQTYAIGKILYLVLTGLKNRESVLAVSNRLRQEYQLSEKEISQVFNVHLPPLTRKLEDCFQAKVSQKSSSYIFFQRILLKASAVERMAEVLKVLLGKTWLILLSSVSLILHLVYGWQFRHHADIGQPFSLMESVFITCFLPGIFIFHELGHAAAVSRFGAKPKAIGFGFYFLFPVLFADVTSAWSLPKWPRVLVNLGGIYFQLLLNIPLITIFLLLPSDAGKHVFSGVITSNLFIVGYSLLPFLRNDGYWVYSDVFNLPNLMNRARAYPTTLYHSLFGENSARPETLKTDFRQIPLLLFTVGNYAFIGFLLYAYWQFVLGIIHEWHLLIQSAAIGDAEISQYAKLGLKTAFIVGISAVTLYNKATRLKRPLSKSPVNSCP